MIKIPSKIQVSGHWFTIEMVTEGALRGKKEKDPELELCGDMCPIYKKIRILKTLRPDMLYSTLLHECIHAVIALSGQTERLEQDHEESLTVALECGIVTILPELSKVLASMEKPIVDN